MAAETQGEVLAEKLERPRQPKNTLRTMVRFAFWGSLTAGMSYLAFADSTLDLLGDKATVSQGFDEANAEKTNEFQNSNVQEQFEMDYIDGYTVEMYDRTGGTWILGSITVGDVNEYSFGSDCLEDTLYDPDNGAGVLFAPDDEQSVRVLPANPNMDVLELYTANPIPGWPAALLPKDKSVYILESYGCEPATYEFADGHGG